MPDPIATLSVSPGRRVFALLALAGLGVLMLYVAVARPPAEIGWQIFLIVLGGLILWQAEQLRRATALSVMLLPDQMVDSGGKVLFRIEDVLRVDRGAFAFKPSNGFLVVLKEGPGSYWAPGLWWRIGRRVGVGGVTSRHEAKAMAEALALMLAQRET